MSGTNMRAGRCLCEAVTYLSGPTNNDVLQCHCANCRHLSGNFVGAVRSPTRELRVHDPDGLLRWYDLDYASYAFCQQCGSTLFFRAADRQDITSVMVGTLDDASDLAVSEVWFASECQPHNILPTGVPHHEGSA